ncbi:unnamed protein product [Cylindrotheca closterium]|uniref:Uncharacterized protein n=1 Tax=Cylindrotheca closterium TaxID=2856 RepID=A0AAD2FP96_9STRA|nr:unnamed protein product [Cylindrotheca closterium]
MVNTEASNGLPAPAYVSDEDEELDDMEYFYPSSTKLSVPDDDDDDDDDGEKPQPPKTTNMEKKKKKKTTKPKKKKSKSSSGIVIDKSTDNVTGFLDLPSPVKKSDRRLSFPLQKADMEDEDDAVDSASAELRNKHSALHKDDDDDVDVDELFQVSTPSGSLRKSSSMDSPVGSNMSASQRRRAKIPNAPSESKNGKIYLTSPAIAAASRKSSNVPTPDALGYEDPDAAFQNDKSPIRQHSTNMNNHPPSRQRSSDGSRIRKQPMRRGSTTMDEDQPAVTRPPPVRRGSTMDAVQPPPPRSKSTVDATFTWQPRAPQQSSRRRSSMSSMKPSGGGDANALFYVDPFAKTSKKTQLEQGKKIEQERVTRRNSLPKAAMILDQQPNEVATPTATPKMRHSKSADFDKPFFGGDDDDPYDEEGNLIRRKAPRRRSVTNTPQRFNAVDSSAVTPEFNWDRTIRLENNMKEAMQIDPFEDTEEDLNTSDRLKGFPSEAKVMSKKGKKKKKGNLKDHLRKSSGSKGSKDGKEVASMGSKSSANTKSTAGSSDPAGDSLLSGIHTSDFKKNKPRMEALKGGGEGAEEKRVGRSVLTLGSPNDPRRRSKNRGKSTETPETPKQKKSLLDRHKSTSPRRGKKPKSGRLLSGSRGLSISNHSTDLSSDDDDELLLQNSPKRASEGSTKPRRTKEKSNRKFEPPNRTRSDAGPRAIRISMTGDVDLLGDPASKESSMRLLRSTSIDEDGESLDGEPNSSVLTAPRNADQEESQKRNSGGARRRRLSIGNTNKTQARTSKSPSPRKPTVAHRLMGRRNSLF